MSEALQARVRDFLGERHVMTLATHGAAGPWAAAVFYVHDDFRLLFLSSPTSRHAIDIAHDPRVAVTIQADHDRWNDIRGVQLEGRARELAGADAEHARSLYAAKFPLVSQFARAPVAIVRALAKIRWYEVRPERLYFIDNLVAFGHRDQVIPEND